MLGLVTQGQILVGITYRTNNISSLEEKNIKLFIEHAEKDLDIKNIFGPKGEKVFREFEDFHAVMTGISKVSKRVEKSIGIRGFDDIKRVCKSSNYEEEEDGMRNIYGDGGPYRQHSTTFHMNITTIFQILLKYKCKK